ncbi:MAG TPA: HAMP domain-containing sensor histidine kinase [Solirubrobacteraceae bacterium]
MRGPASIRWRFAGWVAGVLIAMSAVTFVVVYRETGSELRREIDRDVTGDVGALSQTMRALPASSHGEVLSAARRYIDTQPFSGTSSLLFVIVPGTGSVSNHPEVFGGTGPDDGETPAEQREENDLGRKLLVEHDGFSTPVVPDVGSMRVAERPVVVHGLKVVVGAGEPLEIVTRAEHGIAGAFVLAGAVALGLALIASYLAGAVFSRPLRRMSAVAARVDDGDLHPRMTVSASASREVRVLAESFNHMLDRLATAFAAQRDFVADASHELRTPLTVIAGQLEVLAGQEHPDAEEVRRVERLVGAEIARTARLVDDMLLLAQSDRGDFLRLAEIDLRRFVGDLWQSVGHLADRRFELGRIPDGRLTADPDRLAQALRNLVRNAIEHTSAPDGIVSLEVDALPDGRVRFAVADDGPGIPADERDDVFDRFHRVDAARSRARGGSGLGLAIVKAIAAAHDGAVSAGSGERLGGAVVSIELPGLTRPAAGT